MGIGQKPGVASLFSYTLCSLQQLNRLFHLGSGKESHALSLINALGLTNFKTMWSEILKGGCGASCSAYL